MPLIVNQTITINAPLTTVRDLLTRPELTKLRVSQFSHKLSHIESDRTAGSPLIRYDREGKPFLHGEVISIKPRKTLTYTVTDMQSPTPELQNEFDGIVYTLSEKEGETTLNRRHGDFSLIENGEAYKAGTEVIVANVLAIIKENAEKQLQKQLQTSGK